MTKPTAVYYHRNEAGVCLYVGCSASPGNRLCGHQSRSEWAQQIVRMDIKWFPTREEALAFEKAEIARLKPQYNREWRKRRRTGNSGRLYVKGWMDRTGKTTDDLAERLGVRVTIATDGYVPTRAFDGDAFKPVSDEQAREELKYAVDLVEGWACLARPSK